MTSIAWLQLALYFGVLFALIKPLGGFMAKVYAGERTFLSPVVGPLERGLYRLAGVSPDREQDWKSYAHALLAFNLLGLLVVYQLQRLQGSLPFNPQGLSATTPDLAFNTAVSFASNTNWQSYGGETTLSYLTQALGLTAQNFVSAASGMAVLVALARGVARRQAGEIGNFWADLTRSVLYVLLPLSVVGALVLVSQGVVQTFDAYAPARFVDAVTDAAGKPVREQLVALGPAASQIIIKQLGTNGGGFFNANSAHPLENPTAIANFVECLSILLLPAALTYTFGKMVGDTRQGWCLLAAMVAIFVPLLLLCTYAELGPNPQLTALGGLDQLAGNLEGKEARFGVASSALWAAATTAASNGSVNAMLDSFTPLGGLAPLWLMQLGEVVFGGVGSGLYGMFAFAIVAVFVAGLMVGRTPEYLGKKIEAHEMKMASLVILVPAAAALAGAALAALTAAGRQGVLNPGAHGFSEILYAFSSASNNNGSAFGGLTANTPFYNTALGLCMLLGRFWVAVPVLAIAGSLAKKKFVPPGAGTLPTHTPLFVSLVVGAVLLVGALTFLPALALGPIVEHLQLSSLPLPKAPPTMASQNLGSVQPTALTPTPAAPRPSGAAPTPAAPRPSGALPRPSGALPSTAEPTGPGKPKARPLFEGAIVRRAAIDALRKLDPRHLTRNPVMFVVEVGSALTTALFVHALVVGGPEAGFTLAISLWLWFTVLFANFAEAMAEGRGKAQADSLRRAKRDVLAKRLPSADRRGTPSVTPASTLRQGDHVLIEAGDQVPSDGEVVEGVASVNESAITGESAPVIRESGGDRSAVTGGTTVLSDWLVVRVTADPGQTFLDRMIAMVEGAKRKKTPNEIALDILLAALTIVFLLVCVTLLPYSLYGVRAAGRGAPITLTVLAALLVCLIPTTIGGLLSAIGIAGMDRMIQANVIATSGRAVEAAGDVDVLLLDKTGTITLGNRQATAFWPAPGVSEAQLADAAQLASLADETPEGRSIVVLAKEKHDLRERDLAKLGATFVPFTAQTRMSGVDAGGRAIRKGAAEAVSAYVRAKGGQVPADVRARVEAIAKGGGTPLVVAEGARALGVVQLKDVVKGGIKERFSELRKMGIKTVMITGDNPQTAAAIAAEAGVDDFLAEATPEAKLALIRDYQKGGRLVAMTGDGTNDAPALAQADVAVAMNTGTAAAKEAGNMIDLDSNPTKLIEIVEIGKQLLITRGSLTTFSLANDVAKYFAIIPAAFASTYPALGALNVMGLATPNSAIMSAVIFNALVIVALIPLALRGVRYRALGAVALLRRNLLVYGLGGLVVPFLGIKLIDLALVALRLA